MGLSRKCLLMGMLLVSVAAKPIDYRYMVPQAEGGYLLKDSLSEAADILEKKDDILEKNEDILEKNDDILEKNDDILEKIDDLLEKNDDILEDADDIRKKTDDIREKEAIDEDWEAYRKTLFERAGFEGENGWTRPLFNEFLEKYSELVSSGVPDHNIRFDHHLRIFADFPTPAEREKYRELYDIVNEFYEKKGSEASLKYLGEKIREFKEAGVVPVQFANDVVGDIAAVSYLNKEDVSRTVQHFLGEYKITLFGEIFEEASTVDKNDPLKEKLII